MEDIEVVNNIRLNERQETIIEIVRENEPITSEAIASKLKLTRSTIRPDLSILTMSGILDARPKVGYFYTGKSSFGYISEKIKDYKVAEVKSRPVVVDESTSLYDTIVAMFLEDVGSIYITTGGILSGVVSRKDLLKNVMGGTELNKIPIGITMTRMPNLIYVRDEDSVYDAALKMIDHEIDSLPVVEEIDEDERTYKVVGRITKTTITRLFVELGSGR